MAYKRKFKSKFAKKSSKRRKPTLKKSTVKAVRKIAVSAVMKKVETKHKGFIHAKAELNHNNWLPAYCSTMNAVMPSQGLGDNDRIGDRIQALGYKLKLFFGQKGDRPNVIQNLQNQILGHGGRGRRKRRKKETERGGRRRNKGQEESVERGGRLGRNRTKIYSITTSLPPNTTAWQASLY